MQLTDDAYIAMCIEITMVVFFQSSTISGHCHDCNELTVLMFQICHTFGQDNETKTCWPLKYEHDTRQNFMISLNTIINEINLPIMNVLACQGL